MTTNADEDVEKPDHSCIAGRNIKWYIMESSLAVSYKTKHVI